MADCKACGGRADRELNLKEVLTLHVRDLGGEKRVQALGHDVQMALCHGCLDRYIETITKPVAQIKKAVLLFGGIVLAGLLIVLVLPAVIGVDMRLAGFGAIGLGVFGFVKRYQAIEQRKAEALKAGTQKNRETYLMEYVHTLLPKKEGENDLSYVPMNEATAAMNIGTLAATHALLPEIARQLLEQLHGKQEGEETK